MKLKNKRWNLDKFKEVREEVLKQWSTGEDVDLEEAIEYHKDLPKKKVMAEVLAIAKEEKATLIQPRAGVALIDEHIELLKFLRKEGQADLLPSTIDSYTRQNNYQEAEQGIKESRNEGRSMLNGFPAVNHGVDGCRKVVEALDAPLQVRHGTPDARLLAEIAIAGGFTDYEGGGISYNIPYAKDVSIKQTLYDWQYVDRLIGYYEEQGVKINREPFGPLTGTLVPPSVSHSIAIIEGLLAAEQGVKSITLGYGQCGNLVQDVAAIHSLKELAEEYLAEYDDIMLTTVFHQWMGGFPQDEAQAFGVISWGAATAALANATKVIVKTPHEALGVPTKEANAQGLRTTKQLVNMLKDQQFVAKGLLEEEKEMIRKETKQILNRVLELGDGDLAQGTVRAFEAGVLDIPFAPSKYNAGNLLPARDNNGAIRYLNHGNLPFSEEVIKFNKERLEERGRDEEREPSFQMVIDDIYAIGKGMLVGKPRS
ncbi:MULTISPECIES: methylaspartate mutase subunit E [unclassified Candidatus Frackibacter]|uniref:methylaspartate mutase subunit E n=1 Tax=unclassified Candidatus Frackibacter TaxID=2648818 RepID=UPI000793983C|nr:MULTISPECIES: methylaspartate mutase subunit E [unclassified Candidatus Frackibacter]KXS43960.1 MAG: methylaspartate mutase [Candidatus Frackibacter sp. T328-2]SDC75523.1 Glutamate mutase subunit E [Candidatus Frackibacter sp. WG11]SEM89225.1 Glutamate mutase subunit E [Candidatus Frackibacter sp. WG12]SFL98654.1 Glutamate mutase subunit E [Candidatus Frackibacter sp. WG13]